MITLTIPFNIHKLESLSDLSIKMTVYTENLNADDMTKLFGLQKKQAWAVVGESMSMEVNKEELANTMLKKSPTGESPSKRLRSVLCLIWGMDKKGVSFEDYYAAEMDKIIEHFKTKLP